MTNQTDAFGALPLVGYVSKGNDSAADYGVQCGFVDTDFQNLVDWSPIDFEEVLKRPCRSDEPSLSGFDKELEKLNTSNDPCSLWQLQNGPEWLLQQPLSKPQRSNEFTYPSPEVNLLSSQPDAELVPTQQASNLFPHYNIGFPLTAGDRTPSDFRTSSFPPESLSGSEYFDDDDETPIAAHAKSQSWRRRDRKVGDRSTSRAASMQQKKTSRHLTKPNPVYVRNKAYQPLQQAPKSWGIFRYTIDGELEPSDLFTAKEITRYLFEHPLHGASPNRRNSRLVLWIGRNPPDSANRFPTVHGSHRCRFQDCLALNNTINQGTYAVIFDELTTDHPDHDPFLNAAWVHLYCLEKLCNLPKICKVLNVQAEKRDFNRESSKYSKGNNRMRLDKIRGVEELVEDFINDCRQGVLPENYPCFNVRDERGEPYVNTLCYKMNMKKQRAQPRAANRQEIAREQAAGRKGATLKNHLGNLAIEASQRNSTRKHANQNQLIANPIHKRTYKHGRARNESNDDNESDQYREDLCENEDEDEEYQARPKRYVAPTANMLPAPPQPQYQIQTQPQHLVEDRGFFMPANNAQWPHSYYQANIQPMGHAQVVPQRTTHFPEDGENWQNQNADLMEGIEETNAIMAPPQVPTSQSQCQAVFENLPPIAGRKRKGGDSPNEVDTHQANPSKKSRLTHGLAKNPYSTLFHQATQFPRPNPHRERHLGTIYPQPPQH